MVGFYGKLVGKYTSPMDPMGYIPRKSKIQKLCLLVLGTSLRMLIILKTSLCLVDWTFMWLFFMLSLECFIHAFGKELLLMEEIWQIAPGWSMYFLQFYQYSILGILAHLLRMEPKYLAEEVIVHPNHHLTR